MEGEEISDQIAVPTAAAATTLRVVKKCREVTARLAGIAGEFTIQPLVVQGLTHPVNLGQHFLSRHWCSLDFASRQELRKIMEATAEADWPQEARIALGEKVAEIRRLAEAQGDKGLLQVRGAAYALLGGATPEWAANQEVRHREEKDTLREETRVAKQQLKELRERWQERKADFQRSDRHECPPAEGGRG